MTFPLQLFPAATGVERSLKKLWLRRDGDGEGAGGRESPSPKKTWDENGAITPSVEKLTPPRQPKFNRAIISGGDRNVNTINTVNSINGDGGGNNDDDDASNRLLEENDVPDNWRTGANGAWQRKRLDSTTSLPPPEWAPWKGKAVRMGLIVVIALAAAFFPDLTALLAIIGCTTAGVLAMLLPAWMNLVIRRRYKVPIGFGRWCTFIILNLVGVFTCTVGNYYAVIKLAESLRPTPPDPDPNMTIASTSGYHPGSPWWSAPSADVGSWHWDTRADELFGPTVDEFEF